MNTLGFALLYGFFSLLFVFTNLEALQIPIVSSIGDSVNQRLRDAPFSFLPLKKLDDIKTSLDIYEWTHKSLIPILYGETEESTGADSEATDGAPSTPTEDSEGYCIRLSKNNCDNCARKYANLTSDLLNGLLYTNGNYYEKAELLKWCRLNGATNFDLDKVCHPVLGRKDYCKQSLPACPDPLLSTQSAVVPIEYLDGYVSTAADINAFELGNSFQTPPTNITCPGKVVAESQCCSAAGVAAAGGVPGSNVSPSFYPPLLAQQGTAGSSSLLGSSSVVVDGAAGSGAAADGASNTTSRTPVRIAGFNEVLLLRFTLKRHKFEESKNPLFRLQYPWVFQGGSSGLSASSDNGDREFSEPFVGPKSGTVYEYQASDGHAQAGGYVVTLDLSKFSEQEVKTRVDTLYEDGWFDLQLGSFAVDLVIFNGNWRQFLLLGFSWVAPFSGSAYREETFQYVSLDLYNGLVPGVYLRIALEVIVYVLLILFVILEIKQAQFIGVDLYFAKGSTYVNNFGLLLSWVVVILQLVRTTSQPKFAYLFSEEDPAVVVFSDTTYSAAEEAMARADFKSLENYLAFVVTVQTLTAINLTVVFAKAVVLVSDLSPYLSLISNVLVRAFPFLVSFTGLYFIVFGGFVLFGYFLFGQHIFKLSTLSDAFIYLFALCCGGSAVRWADFTGADPILGPIYIFFFYLVMIFTLMNVFLSILLGSYDIEKFELERRVAAGTTTNAVADASNYMKRTFTNSVLIPTSDLLRWLRVTIFGPPEEPGAEEEEEEDAVSPSKSGGGEGEAGEDGGEEGEEGGEGGENKAPPAGGLTQRVGMKAARAGPPPPLLKRMGTKMMVRVKAAADRSRKQAKRKRDVFHAYIESTALADYFGPSVKLPKNLDVGETTEGTTTTGPGGGQFAAQKPDLDAEGDNSLESPGGIISLLNLLLFVLLFVLLMALQIRGDESFALTLANKFETAYEPRWVDLHPLRSVDYDSISSLTDVFQWSKAALVNELYKEPACVSKTGGVTLLSEVPGASCDVSELDVNRVADWNSGFQYTTFVRVTVQEACYESNPDATWKATYPYLRSNGLQTECAFETCSLSTCVDRNGNDRPRPSYRAFRLYGGSGSVYEYLDPEKLGTFATTGGFQIYLSKNFTTALQTLENLRQDLLLSEVHISSIVFDFVTQNSNIDLYVYNSFAFSQSETGLLLKKSESVPLPFAIFSEGNYFASGRTAVLVLGVLYFLCVLIYLYEEIKGIREQQIETFKEYNENPYGVEKPHMFQFLIDHYAKSGFNILETLSTLSSVIILFYFFMYLLHAFRGAWFIAATRGERYPLPNEEVKSWDIPPESADNRLNEEDAYVFYQFEALRTKYNTIVTFAAVNSLFLTLKVVSFVLSWKLFYIIATTLSRALSLIMTFTVVMTLQLLGFALLFHVKFGAVVPELKSPLGAFDTMFRFLLGDFERILEQMKQKSDVLSSVMFILFMLFFYFLLIQIYLATMMSTYSNCVSNVTVKKAHVVAKYDLQAAQAALAKKLRDEERKRKKRAMSVIEEEGDPQTTMLIARTLNCVKGIVSVCTGGDKEAAALFEDVGKRQLVATPAEFWRANGGLAEVNRDVVELAALFKHPSDIEGATKKTPGYLSLTPEFAMGTDYERVREQLQSLELNRIATGGGGAAVAAGGGGAASSSPETKMSSQSQAPQEQTSTPVPPAPASAQAMASTSKIRDVGAEPLLTAEEHNEFYHRCLKNTLTDIMFTSKGARLFTNDETSHTFQVEDFADVTEMAQFIASHLVYGEELWLDSLVSALEEENSHFVNTLFTKDAKIPPSSSGDGAGAKLGERVLEKLRKPLFEGGEMVLSYFEYKAKAEFYSQVLEEASLRKTLCRQQNRVLHDYVTELQGHISGHFATMKRLERRKLFLLEKLQAMV